MAKRLTAAQDKALREEAERATRIPPMRTFRVRVRAKLNEWFEDLNVSAHSYNLVDADNGIVVFCDYGHVDYTPSGDAEFYRRMLWHVVDVEEIYAVAEPEGAQ